MKFLVDTQLPRGLALALVARGYDALHTSALPEGNRTTDAELCRISLAEERIMVTKDADFQVSLALQATPYKLLLMSTGNISNAELRELFERNFERIIAELREATFIEMTRASLIVHY